MTRKQIKAERRKKALGQSGYEIWKEQRNARRNLRKLVVKKKKRSRP